MDLWNQYEGRTVAEIFPLDHLLRPEGRSAFFSTQIKTDSGASTSTVIRLIEAHFDEADILGRWKAVEALKDPNLLQLHRFGHVILDDTSLVYAVMEPTDADLSQILRERRLTSLEARQVAVSLVQALQSLHGAGLIHEHIQPMHVLAVGETVKLRSDCIREAPEGREGEAARAADVRDLALVLLEALTLERDPQNTEPPPAPFREIIANAINGRWGLDHISQILEETAPKLPPQPATRPGAKVAAKPLPLGTSSPASATVKASSPEMPKPRSAEPPTPYPASGLGTVGRPAPKAGEAVRESAVVPHQPHRFQPPTDEPAAFGSSPVAPTRFLFTLIAGAVLLLLLFLVWHLSHRHPSAQATSAPANQAVEPTVSTAVATLQAKPQPTQPTNQQAAPSNPHALWRVVAYTYNRRPQAEAKAKQLGQAHPDVAVDVFSPTSRAPFLVTLGGPMTREAATDLRNASRGKGFPRDIYIENFRR